MFPIPTGEKLIETKVCRQCRASFPITDKDVEFYGKVSPVFNGKKYQIPTPTLCPDCRQQRRLAWRNERKLYKRNCDATGKEIISIYSPDKKRTIYDYTIWWSDSWNPLSYGKNYDPSASFIDQFNMLLNTVPEMSLIQDAQENSQYTNDSHGNKNCYYLFTANTNEYCYYGNSIFGCKNSMEVLWGWQCESCYEMIKSVNCFACYYGMNLTDCRDCRHCFNCSGCHDCDYCINLSGKQYHILNVPYEKQEYTALKKKLSNNPSLQAEYLKKYETILLETPRKALLQIRCENVLGDLIENGKQLVDCFDCIHASDSKYLYSVGGVSDVYDCTITGTMDQINSRDYEGMSVAGTNNSIFNVGCWFGAGYIYSYNCFNSSHLFGCIGLRNKQYCILNKQYTKEQYEELIPKIIEKMMADGEWGEFFPASLSPFGYNETVANEYFPLEKSEALKLGFNWSDYEAPFPKVEKIIPASKLPDDITKIPDDILNWAIECEVTGKPFRIIKQELEFYRKHNLPIPRRHPDQRHKDRMSLRNPRKLFERKCDKCSKDMLTTYAPERPEIVYCEACYNSEIV